MTRTKRSDRLRKNLVRSRLLSHGLEQLEARRVLAIAQAVVTQINDDPAAAFWSPANITPVGSKVFFSATTPTAGNELWVTDGTSAGTSLVKDIVPGSSSSSPASLTAVNGMLFFTVNSNQLWSSDGTAAGTSLVTSGFFDVRELSSANGLLFLSASDGVSSNALWKSDGTAAGTMRVADANAPAEYPRNIVSVGNLVYFRGYSVAAGYELWKSDGTAAGTTQVKDIAPGSTYSDPQRLTNLNGTLVFTAEAVSGDRELWSSDGTESGTIQVKDIYSGSYGSHPDHFAVVGTKLFFSASDPSVGRELWVSDGTGPNTILLKDINVGSSSSPTSLTNVNGTLFFGASSDLWKSNGTEAGTVLVRDSAGGQLLYPTSLANGNGALFFFGYEAGTGYELWKSDGSSAGTVLVKDIVPGSGSNSGNLITAANNFVAFFPGSGQDLWSTDGSQSGTVPIKSFANATSGSSPSLLTNVNGTLFFAASEGTSSTELWKSNGSAAGTVLAGTSTLSGSYLKSLAEVNGTTFYVAFDADHGYELWKSDGTAAGTLLVADIAPGTSSSNPRSLTNVNGTLMFVANNGISGYELWKSDGTAAGTVQVKDIRIGSYASYPQGLTNINGVLFFSAADGAGYELWKSDGTPAGTIQVKDIIPGPSSSSPTEFTNLNGVVVFSASTATGRELWKTDGTASGTQPVRDLEVEGYYPTAARNLANINGELYFSGNSQGSGFELWKSDGTDVGTVLVKNIDSAAYYGGNPQQFLGVNGIVYFVAELSSGKQLWKTDGTAGGTELVKSIAPSQLVNFNGQLLLAANDGTSDDLLWTSDGTEVGTVVAEHTSIQQRPTKVGNLTVVDNLLLFSGLTDLGGRELYLYDTNANVNEAPTDVILSNAVVAENLVAGSAVGTLTTVDPDAGDTFTYTLVSGTGSTDNSSFTIDGSILKTASSFNFEAKNSYSIRVRSTDSGLGSFEKVLTITIANVNETPTAVSLSNAVIAENLVAGSNVGTLSTTDPDTGNSFTYTLVAGIGSTDNGLFTISGSTLKTAAVFNFEAKNSYSIRVRSTDSGSSSLDKVLTITVANVNETPTAVNLSNAVVAENLAPGNSVGILSTTDPDTADSFTYTFVSGTGSTDNGLFTISGSTLKTASSFNFEAKNSYPIRVRSTDSSSNSFEKVLVINVTNVNETPTAVNLSNAVVAENLAPGNSVGILSTTDPDAGDTFTYSLVSGTGSTDNGSFTILNNELRVAASFDFETKNSYSILVRSTDGGNAVMEQIFTIDVTGLNEAPTAIALSATSIAENKPAGTVVGNFSSADPDSGNSFTYKLVAGAVANNNGSFQIVGNQLKTKFVFNFEVKPSYTVRVRTTDQNGLSFDKDFTITVTNVNERPTGLNLSASAVAENKPAGTVVGNFSSTDPDSGSSFTYKLVTGAVANNNGSFQIVGNQLKTKFVFNFEVKPSYTVRVRTTDQNGLSFDKDFTITVTNVNERPTGLNLSASAVAENKPAGTVVGNFSSTDPDSGSSFTYKLVTGAVANNNGSFQIVGNQLKTKFVFNFEVKPSYTVRVRTTDQNGLSFDKDFTINVTNAYEGPTLGGISGSIGYVRGGVAQPITTGATLSGGTFAPTKLRVRITDGASAANVLGFTSSVTVDSSNVVRLGSTIVGTRASNGVGTNELLINFQSNVTRDVAQQVAKALTFKTVAGAVVGPRKVLVSVFDGSLFSPEVSKLVSVS